MTLITEEISAILRRGSFKDIQDLAERVNLAEPDENTKQNAFFYLCLRVEPELQTELSDICDYLRSKDVDPILVDANGQTPLFYACRDGNVFMVDYLMDCGVNVDHIDIANAQTALFFAARDGRLDVVDMLVKKGGAKVDFIDRQQQTPLFYAASNGRDAVVQRLIELGADPNLRDLQRRTPAWFARTNGFPSTEAVLKSAAAANPPASSASMPRTSRASKARAVSRSAVGTDVALDVPGPSTRSAHRASSATSRPSSVVMMGGGPAVPVAPPAPTRSNRKSEAAQSNVPRYQCRIVCRPVGATRWIVADDDALGDLEAMVCPELAQWTRVPQSSVFEDEWNKKWQKEARILLDNIHKFEFSIPFHKPVDIQKMKCLNYYDIIKYPMDFSKVRQRLKELRYRKPSEFLGDMALTFENCRRYNTATSEVAICGVKTEEKWEIMVKESTLPALEKEFQEYEKRKDTIYRARKGLWKPEDDPSEMAAIAEAKRREEEASRAQHEAALAAAEEMLLGALSDDPQPLATAAASSAPTTGLIRSEREEDNLLGEGRETKTVKTSLDALIDDTIEGDADKAIHALLGGSISPPASAVPEPVSDFAAGLPALDSKPEPKFEPEIAAPAAPAPAGDVDMDSIPPAAPQAYTGSSFAAPIPSIQVAPAPVEPAVAPAVPAPAAPVSAGLSAPISAGLSGGLASLMFDDDDDEELSDD